MRPAYCIYVTGAGTGGGGRGSNRAGGSGNRGGGGRAINAALAGRPQVEKDKSHDGR